MSSNSSVASANSRRIEQRPDSALDGLGEAEQRVYEALPARGRRTADQIAIASGLPPTQVLGPLSMLEVCGLVIRDEGYWKLKKVARRRNSRRSYNC